MSVLDESTRQDILQRVLAARQQRPEILAYMRDCQQQGWAVDREGARILKEQFGAAKGVLLGSMLDLERLWSESDQNLAMWRLSGADGFQTVALLSDEDPEFPRDRMEVQQV